jgi:DNA-binding response OmpR family regulator
MAKILIVDDEPLITAMMEDWLSELGHLVVGPAHDLATAMKLATSEIDAAVVDVSLGKDNSYPLVEALIAGGLPFALATGYGQDGIEPRYRGRLTLRKPFDFATFRGTIDELLAKSSRPADSRNAPGDSISATR